jgi:heme-degrading monooxygenase HmoA
MISRHWIGIAKRDHADAYVEHLEADTFPKLGALPGFVRATILRRERAEGTEFRIVTLWDSVGSIRAFAGSDVEAAVVPDNVQAMMIDYDRRATHYEVVATVESDKSAGPDVP